jgi:hypothetical protein
LLAYEDARFNSLLSGIPDCYSSLTDSTLWGTILRALAMELARIEYFLSYDIVTENPPYLTPPDIKRIYGGPLGIAKSFPTSTQSDQDYRALCVNLLAAYLEGGTVDALEKVVTAYTGDTVQVAELYKLIGNGVYTQSDINRLRVVVPLVGATPLTATATANRIATISDNLYAALDLIKPAHVLLDYAIGVGSDEDLSDKLLGIEDTMTVVLSNAEVSPLEAPFTMAPFLDPSSPDTRIAAEGILAGAYMAPQLTAAQWAALPYPAFQAEYLPDGLGHYIFDPNNAMDVLITDPATDLPTGEISKAQGLLAPKQTANFLIKGETLSIYEID